MMTLTFFRSQDVLSCWNEIGKKCNRLLTYMRLRHKDVKYIRVIEPHKIGGWPHIHILTDRYVLDSGLSKKLTKWGFGWNFHSKHVPAKTGAGYISKYLSKPWPEGSADLYRTVSRTRIVSASRNLGPIFAKDPQWELVSYGKNKVDIESLVQVTVNELRKCKAIAIEVHRSKNSAVIFSDVDLPEYTWDFNYANKEDAVFLEKDYYECLTGSQLSLFPVGNVPPENQRSGPESDHSTFAL